MWFCGTPYLPQIAAYLAPAIGVSGLTAGLTVLILGTILCSAISVIVTTQHHGLAGLMAFEPVCAFVGGQGASFNPALNFAFAATGKGSFTRHTLRSVRPLAHKFWLGMHFVFIFMLAARASRRRRAGCSSRFQIFSSLLARVCA